VVHPVNVARRIRAATVKSVLVLLLTVSVGGAGTESYEYDALGRLHKVTYANGSSTTYSIDATGNRTSATTDSGSPSYVGITSSNGTIVASAASLYTVNSSCQSSPPWATVCSWVVRKLYGDNSAVIAVVDAPNGTNPGCSKGVTQSITTGYVRSGCMLSALSTVYGH